MDERSLDVNEYGVLRIPAALWLALVLQCRHWVLGLMLLFAGQQGQTIWQLLDTTAIVGLLAMELPALWVFFACAARRPEAGRVVRTTWSWLKPLLALSVVAHIAYAAWHLWHATYWQPWPEMAVACLVLLDTVILYSLFGPGHWQAVLSEFPIAKKSPSIAAK